MDDCIWFCYNDKWVDMVANVNVNIVGLYKDIEGKIIAHELSLVTSQLNTTSITLHWTGYLQLCCYIIALFSK